MSLPGKIGRSETLKVTFADKSSEDYHDEPLASGAEGSIFRSVRGDHVIKLYKPGKMNDAERINRIDLLINQFNPATDPYWSQYFTWPEKRVIRPQIGFRMRYVHMKMLSHYVYSRSYSRLPAEERGWFIGKVAAAIKLAAAAQRLSFMGLCYPDFSEKNVLVEPFAGRMVLIDCDSLCIPTRLSATVEGANWYRAPEIVMGTKLPSVLSDRHALAAVLYRWLLLWHPLIGDKQFDLDPAKDDELRFGQRAIYVEHPNDPSNRATKQVFTSRVLGPPLERLFRRAFVDGLHAPEKRPQPYEWQQALIATYDRLLPCASADCDWHFYVALPPSGFTCPRCRQRLKYPKTVPLVYLHQHRHRAGPEGYDIHETDAHFVVGWQGRPLYLWHTRSDATATYTNPAHPPDTSPCAMFEYDRQAQVWSLTNLTLPEMRYRAAGGEWRPCPPRTSIQLATGVEIQFGNAAQHFRASVTLERVG